MIGVFGRDFSDEEAKKGLEHICCKDLKLDEKALKEGTKGGRSFRALLNSLDLILEYSFVFCLIFANILPFHAKKEVIMVRDNFFDFIIF